MTKTPTPFLNGSTWPRYVLLLLLNLLLLPAFSQTVTITGTPQETANVSPGFRNRILYLFKVDVAGGPATLTGITGISTTGNYLTSDIRASQGTTPDRGFRLHHVSTIGTITSNPNLPGTNQLVNTLESTIGGTIRLTVNGNSTGSGQPISGTFASPVSLAVGSHFFYLTVDLSTTAAIGRTVGLNAFDQSAFQFAGTPTVNSVSFPASGLQTFKNATITVNGVAPAAATVERGSAHVPLYRVDVTTSGAATQIGDPYGTAQMMFNLDGSAIAPTGTTGTTDLNRFRLVYSHDQVIDATDQVISGGTDVVNKTLSAPNLPLGLPEGVTRSIYLTTHTQPGGTIGSTVQVTNVTLNAPSGTTVVRGLIPVGGLQTLGSDVAKVELTGVRLPAEPLLQGTKNNPLGYLKVGVVDATTVLSKLTVQTSGSFLGSDYTAFKLWASNSTTFDPANAILVNTITSGAFSGFLWSTSPPGLSPIQGASNVKHYPLYTTGTTVYYHLTVDVAPSANVGSQFAIGFNSTASNTSNTTIPGVRTVTTPTSGARPVSIYAQVRTNSLINQSLNLPRGASNQVLYKFKTAVLNTGVTLNDVNLNVNTTNFSDITDGYKLYYSSASNFNPATATQIGATVVSAANTQTLTFTPGAPISIAAGEEVYFYLVANTNAEATLGNTIVVNAPGDNNLSFSSGVKIFTTTTTTHTISGPPQITLTAGTLPTENIARGTKNVMVYQMSVQAAVADADFTGITLKTAGSAAGISYRLYYSTNSAFDKSDVQIGSVITASGANQDLAFNVPAPIRLEVGNTATLFLIADVSTKTLPGTSVGIAAPENANIRFLLGDVLGTPAAGALKSIVAPPVVTVSSDAPVTNQLAAGSRNFIAYKAAIAVDASAYANLTGVSIQTKSAFQPTDISSGFKFYLSADNNLDASDRLLGSAGIAVTPQLVSLTLPDPVRLNAGQQTNLLVITDVSQFAKVGNQIQLEALSLERLKFESSANTGTTQVGNIAVIGAAVAESFPYSNIKTAPMVPGCTGTPDADADNTYILDVTLPPFNADKTGVQDATEAFRAALAISKRFVYIPNGTYRFTDSVAFSPIEVLQNGRMSTGGSSIQMWGESREGVILKLDANSPAFSDPSKPRAFFKTGSGSPDRFNNSIWNVTFEIGTGNPGAIGLKHFLHNLGGLYNVTIRTLGEGKIGLDKGYNRANGPSYTKDVLIEGFETGISTDFSVESEVYEHITLKNQTKRAWHNGKQILSIRDLKIINCAGPAFINESGFVNILDSDFQGTGDAAIVNGAKGQLLIRNLKTSGYTKSISDPDNSFADGFIQEYLTNPATGRDGKPTTASTLNLPIKETPVIPWDAPSTWVNVGDFGATANGICNGVGVNNCQPCDDDAPAIQRAIDATLPGGSRAGATTLFLPGRYRVKSSIRLRGSIRRIVTGSGNTGGSSNGFLDDGITPTPINWVVEAGTYPEVEFSNFQSGGPGQPGFPVVKNTSGRTLIFKNCGLPTLSITGGEAFFESCSMGYADFTNVDIWARQIDPEANQIKLTINGGTYWGLGLKTELGNGIIAAKNAKIEQFGGYIYSTHDSRGPAMFKFENTEASVSMFEYLGYFGNPFTTLVDDTQGASRVVLTRGPNDAPTYPATWSQNNDGTTDRVNGIVGSSFLLYRNVSPLNIAPSFALSQDVVNGIEGEGARKSISNFASDITDNNPGANQVLTFKVTTDNNALFEELPALDVITGTLTFKQKSDASGLATVTVLLKDNGSDELPNLNTSAPQTFTIDIAPINDVPTLDALANSSLAFNTKKNVPLSGITSGSPFETQTLTVSAVSSNTNLVTPAVDYLSPAATGTLTLTPGANLAGTAVITVTVTDDGGTANGGVNQTTRTFTVTVEKGSQTINFAQLADYPFESGPFELTAAATSGLPVSYTLLSGPAKLSGTTITPTGIGPVTIRATQAGDNNYLAAAQVTQTFSIVTTDRDRGVKPVLECVTDNRNGTFTARFGYKNDMGMRVYIAAGTSNYLSPANSTTLPEFFETGDIRNVISLTFESRGSVSWSIIGPDGKIRTATATRSSVRCAAGARVAAAGSGAESGELTEGQVYPNPASGKVFVRVNADREQRANVKLVSNLSKVALEEGFALQAGNNVLEIGVQNLPSGVYTLQLYKDEQVITHKVVIRR